MKSIDCYAFRRIKKFCEICRKKLKLTTNSHIERKRFCSVSCRMKGTNIKRLAKPVAPFHTCRKCGKLKPVCDFYTNSYKGKNHPRQYCKKCYKLETYALFKLHPEWVEKIKTRRRIKRKSLPFRMESARDLGLTIAEALKLYTEQDGKCAICAVPPQNGRRLSLDHNHETGKPRQFLCCACNTDLSVIENTARFEKLKAYLRKHETNN